MKAKYKGKGPLELEFEITGSKTEALKWLDKALDFVGIIPYGSKISLKAEIKEIVVPELNEKKEVAGE